MSGVFRKAAVYVQDIKAGTLEETDEGYIYTYDTDYICGDNPVAVSLTLPIREESYRSPSLFPFFDGLIPEGWLLNVIVHNWKTDINDRFGLLLISCRDCIGDVSIIPAGVAK